MTSQSHQPNNHPATLTSYLCQPVESVIPFNPHNPIDRFSINLTSVTKDMRILFQRADTLYLHLTASVSNARRFPYPPCAPQQVLTPIYSEAAQLSGGFADLQANQRAVHRRLALMKLEGYFVGRSDLMSWVRREMGSLRDGVEELSIAVDRCWAVVEAVEREIWEDRTTGEMMWGAKGGGGVNRRPRM